MRDEATSPSTPASSGRAGWLLMPSLILAELVSSFEGSMIYAALKQFYQLYPDPVQIGWLVSGYMLVASIAAAICGRLGDIYGRRLVLMIALLVAMIGSLISAFSTQLEWIIAGRSIQGLAGAILPLCYGLVREHCQSSRMKINIGFISATASGGAGLGLILGGVIVDHGSWHMIFILSAILALIAAVMVFAFVPKGEGGGRDARVDWLGAALFICGMALMLYTIGSEGGDGWGATQQVQLALAGLAILAVWVWHELRTPCPMIDVRMLAMRQIWVTLAIFTLAALGSMHISQVVMVMMQLPVATGAGLGVSATMAGLLHVPASIMGVVAAPLAGWVATRRGGRMGMIAAMAMLGTAWVGLTFAHHSVASVNLWMSVNGFGLGALMASAPILIVEVSPLDRVSEATGLAQIVRKIAMACGAQLVAVSLAQSTVTIKGGVFPDAAAFEMTYVLVACLTVAGLLLCLALPARANASPDSPHDI
jgi:MFS family permease